MISKAMSEQIEKTKFGSKKFKKDIILKDEEK